MSTADSVNTAPMLCEKSLTFKLRGLVIPGLFLECSDIQMATVKYWLLPASGQKYYPRKFIFDRPTMCACACV